MNITQADIDRILTPDAFRRWLRTMNDDVPCGTAGYDCRCPIAQFLQDRTGEVVYVNLVIEVKSTGDEFDLPAWAEEFVLELDSNRANSSREEDNPDEDGYWRLADPDDHVKVREARLIVDDVAPANPRKRLGRRRSRGRGNQHTAGRHAGGGR